MELNLKNLKKEEIFDFVLTNSHLFRLEENMDKFNVVRRRDGAVVAECEMPREYQNRCEDNKYTLLSMTSDTPVRMEIPCVAKVGDYMWYCCIREKDSSDIDGGYYFDIKDICQVKITSISGCSDISIVYSGVDVRGEVVAGMQSLFHHTLEETLAFIEEANKSEDVCEFFRNYQVSYDDNRKNKARFPYLLVNNRYLINERCGNSDRRIRRIVFSSDRHSYVQFTPEWKDERNCYVPRTPDLYAVHKFDNAYAEFTLNDGRVVSNVMSSDNISWASFEFEDNK